jgi:hypothetical protein
MQVAYSVENMALFLTYGGIRKEIIATTFTIFTFK